MINLYEPVWTIKRDTLGDTLTMMAKHGQSVLLNWGEDNNLWECSWITSGIRLTGFGLTPEVALSECIAKARNLVNK